MDYNMRRAFIVYERYYDFDNNIVLSGGVQTYISNLLPILKEAGYMCEVYQFEAENRRRTVELTNCVVKSVPNSRVKGICDVSVVMNALENVINKENDLLIYADHILTTKNDVKHTLSIQHGIHWDIRQDVSRKNYRMFLSKALFAYREHKRMSYVNNVVCVDYNFLNWYRAQVDVPSSNFTVIPNFTKISPVIEKSDGVIKIMFARRFVKHRGTRVFAEVAERLLSRYDTIEITVAGRGPDESYLHDKLDKWQDRVKFTQYTADQSLDIHADKHIAVVPTVGSEGTSLSLLEAMSAQCATVCTDVGGMTNIILNGYNGKMVSAGDVDQLYAAVESLIENPEERKRIAMTGYETVKCSFSHARWENQWRGVIKSL